MSFFQPLISIIIPVYNRANLIKETIESVKCQTYNRWECIVVDDGSTDDIDEVLENYIAHDNRFQFYKRPEGRKKGACTCRNFGLERSSGDFIQFLDSDDLLEKSKIEEQLNILRNSSSLTLVTCKWGSFSSSSSLRVKTKYKSYRDFIPGVNLLYNFGKHDEYFPPLVYLVSRKLIEKAGKWNENISQNQDGEYFTRILLHTQQVIFCGSTSVYYRAGSTGRLSLLDEPKKIQSAIYSWKLIRKHLEKDNKKIAAKYIFNGKRNLFNQIKITHPHLVKENSEFFEEITQPKSWIKRIISR